jgi:hypothetical protein
VPVVEFASGTLVALASRIGAPVEDDGARVEAVVG